MNGAQDDEICLNFASFLKQREILSVLRNRERNKMADCSYRRAFRLCRNLIVFLDGLLDLVHHVCKLVPFLQGKTDTFFARPLFAFVIQVKLSNIHADLTTELANRHEPGIA